MHLEIPLCGRGSRRGKTNAERETDIIIALATAQTNILTSDREVGASAKYLSSFGYSLLLCEKTKQKQGNCVTATLGGKNSAFFPKAGHDIMDNFKSAAQDRGVVSLRNRFEN